MSISAGPLRPLEGLSIGPLGLPKKTTSTIDPSLGRLKAIRTRPPTGLRLRLTRRLI